MRRVLITMILLLLTAFLTASVDWVRMTEEWLKQNPESLPIWLTPEEMNRLDEIGGRVNPTDPPPVPVRSIAEFEPMEGVLVRYPLGIPVGLVAAMSEHVTVVTIVSGTYNQNQAINAYTNAGANMDNCEFIIAPTDSYWTRDYSPFFIFDGNNEMGVVDFSYNRPRPNDDNIPVVFANHNDLPLYGMNIAHTGGNYMSNGYGGASSTQIVYSENTPLTPQQVDDYMEDFLGIIDHIVVQDPTGTYINHIDTWAKFIAPDKIMIRSVHTGHPQYQQIENIADYYSGLTSPYGTPYRVYRVYTPNNQPYTNSLILNDRVYVPQVNSNWDSDAILSYEEAMPGYEIIGIYSSGWQSTDALHCRTKEIADRGMLYIRHYPILNEQPYESVYEIDAYIYPYSGQDLYPDSLLVYYRINSEEFQTVPLTSYGDNNYTVNLSEYTVGDTISYYIYAADMSGRNARHPFIGAPDPHVFVVTGGGIPPVIEHNPPVEVFLNDLPLLLEATVTDSEGVGTVELEYRVNQETSQYEQFILIEGDVYQCEFGTDFEVNDLIQYRIIATDMEDPPNTSINPPEDWYEFTIDIRQVETPYFTPEAGIYEEEIEVVIEVDTPEALIYYTLDESEPGEESLFYTEPIFLDESITIKAIALTESFLPSEVAIAEYIIDMTSVDDPLLPEPAGLHAAYPNPFNPVVTIGFNIPAECHVTLEIFNIKGNRVTTLVDAHHQSGTYDYTWNGVDDNSREVAGGVYFYKMQAGNYSETRKMILLK